MNAVIEFTYEIETHSRHVHSVHFGPKCITMIGYTRKQAEKRVKDDLARLDVCDAFAKLLLDKLPVTP